MDDLREWCIGAASVEIECELRTLSEAQGTKAAAAAFDVIAPKVREALADEITALRGENERLRRIVALYADSCDMPEDDATFTVEVTLQWCDSDASISRQALGEQP